MDDGPRHRSTVVNKRRILAVAHDAGGANILASIASKYQSSFSWHVAVAGPAAGVFSDVKFLSGDDCIEPAQDSLAFVIDRVSPDMVLTGTGWQTRIELAAIGVARNRGIAVASYLDHWTNFRERFGDPQHWLDNLPDFVLVGDHYAYDRACEDGFPRARLMAVENPYLESFWQGFDRREETERVGQKRILFLSEPVQVTFPGQDVPMEQRASPEFALVAGLARLVAGPLAGHARLAIRLHPSEPDGKYDGARALLAAANAEVHSAFAVPLRVDLERTDVAIGIGSMALLAAIAAGVQALAWVPDGIDSVLPHREIRHCRDMEEILRQLKVPAAAAARPNLRLYTEPFDRVANKIIDSQARS